jgi:uncharacterized protein (TIGR02246 family)
MKALITRSAVALLTVMSCMVVIGCTQTKATPIAQPDTRVADRKAISDGEAAWVANWKARDVEKILGYYTDDAVVMDPGVPAVKGKDAIRAALKQGLDDKNFALTFTTMDVEVSKSGDLACSHGTFTETLTDAKTRKPVTVVGKYVTAYRKTADGSWKAILDINNADAPAI